jgi:hypothetical protein
MTGRLVGAGDAAWTQSMERRRRREAREEGWAGIVGGGGSRRGIEEIGARTHYRRCSLGCAWGSDDGLRGRVGRRKAWARVGSGRRTGCMTEGRVTH